MHAQSACVYIYILASDLPDMAEVPLPSDNSIYHSGSSGDESIASITSDRALLAVNLVSPYQLRH